MESKEPVRITRKIRSDGEGNLLIAAFTDVFRYDGAGYAKLPKPPGVQSFDAFDALEDSQGNVWVASTHFGVYRYDGDAFTHFTPANGLAHTRTMDLYEDRQGHIWIATMGGASRYDGQAFQTYTRKDGLPDDDVNVIIEDSKGTFWFGTRGATSMYDPETDTFTEVTSTSGGSLINIRTIMEDREGAIWLGGNDGIWRVREDQPVQVSTKGANHLYEDSEGDIWFTAGSSLFIITQESLSQEQPEATELVKDQGMFFGISEDQAGAIWVGTLQGVLVFDKEEITH